MPATKNSLERCGSHDRLGAPLLAALRTGLSQSLHLVFWGIVLMGIVTLVIAWRVPEMERGAEKS
jgi:hypothetical protein